MKKTIILPISLLLITSCSAVNFKQSAIYLATAEDFDNTLYKSEEFMDFSLDVKNFEYKIFEEFLDFKEYEDNILISPVSIYNCFSMLVPMLNNEAKSELINILELEENLITKYNAALINNLNREFDNNAGKITLKNSVWLEDDFNYNKNVLKQVVDSFKASSFKFDKEKPKESEKIIDSYIKKMTNNLLNGEDIKISAYSRMILLNTLYSKDVWLDGINFELEKDKNVTKFMNDDGSSKDINLLRGLYEEGKPFITKDYSKFYYCTLNGIKLEFIKPNEGLTTRQILEKYDLSEITSQKYEHYSEDLTTKYFTRTHFAELALEYSDDLLDFFSHLGLVSPIKKTDAFTPLCSEENLTITSIIHNTNLNINEIGVEGSAITSIMVEATSPHIEKKEYFDFVIDKGFILSVSYGNQILFLANVSKL